MKVKHTSHKFSNCLQKLTNKVGDRFQSDNGQCCDLTNLQINNDRFVVNFTIWDGNVTTFHDLDMPVNDMKTIFDNGDWNRIENNFAQLIYTYYNIWKHTGQIL